MKNQVFQPSVRPSRLVLRNTPNLPHHCVVERVGQYRIANLFAAPERFVLTRFRDGQNKEVNVTWERVKDIFNKSDGSLTTTEWFYNGLWFDGFWRRYCAVVEAKGNYDWMFPEPPRREPFFAAHTIEHWLQSVKKQNSVRANAMPRAKLEWHFMQESSWLRAVKAGIPSYIAKHTPFQY